MRIARERVRDIVTSNDGNQHVRLASISEIKRISYNYTASWTFYHVTLSDAGRAYLLLVSPRPPSDPECHPPSSTPPGPITLTVLSTLLTKILDTSTIPLPRPVAQADGPTDADAAWLLLRVPTAHPPTASLASVRDQLSPTQRASVLQRLGTHLRALHSVTHDVFGVPSDTPASPPVVPSFAALLAASQSESEADGEAEEMIPYSWQDTFVLRLEQLVDRVCAGGRVDLDVGALRGALCRAIGSFLFEDVEMPRLIWVTGNEEDVIVSLTPGQEDTADVAYILPTFGHALWGDPLMEAWFMPPGPTATMNEGYFEGEEGGTLIVFPRQKTKRMWYTVYLALLVLAEDIEEGETETIRWAKNILPECIESLKHAPCY